MPVNTARTYSDNRSASDITVSFRWCKNEIVRGAKAVWTDCSGRLLDLLIAGLDVIELGGQLLAGALTEGLLDEPAGFTALGACEAAGLNLALTLGVDGDLNDFHEPPPTLMVSLM